MCCVRGAIERVQGEEEGSGGLCRERRGRFPRPEPPRGVHAVKTTETTETTEVRRALHAWVIDDCRCHQTCGVCGKQARTWEIDAKIVAPCAGPKVSQ